MRTGCELFGKCGFSSSNLSADEVRRALAGLLGRRAFGRCDVRSFHLLYSALETENPPPGWVAWLYGRKLSHLQSEDANNSLGNAVGHSRMPADWTRVALAALLVINLSVERAACGLPQAFAA